MKRAKDQAQLISAMRSVGIKVDAYKRNPAGANNGFFLSSIGNGKSLMLYFDPKKTTINYETSSKHKQIVLSVFEGKRTVKEKMNLFYRLDRTNAQQAYNNIFGGVVASMTEAKKVEIVQNNIIKIARSGGLRSRVLPIDVNHSLKSISLNKEAIKQIKLNLSVPSATRRTSSWVNSLNARAMFHVNVEFEVKSTNINILCGIDETHHFASVLPKRVTTVELAHNALRPDSLNGVRGVVRQGEFFYVPVAKQERAILDKKQNNAIKALQHRYGNLARIEALNSMTIEERHVATDTRRIGSTRYVRGAVYHTGGHHKPIFLNGWHKVVRNKEKTMPESHSRQARID